MNLTKYFVMRILKGLEYTYSPMNGQHDVSKELLSVALVSMNDATGMMGMALRDGKCWKRHIGVDSFHLAMTQRLLH